MLDFLRFEWRYFLRRPMVWIFLGIVSLLFFGAASSDFVRVGGVTASIHKNAPSVIQTWYAIMSLVGLLMVPAFVHSAALRDFSVGMDPLVFTSPIRRRDYFFGKFLGSVTVAMIPFLGVSIGAWLGPMMPWVQPNRYGPAVLDAHLMSIVSIMIPNTLVYGVCIYALAILFRSHAVSFIGAMLLLVLYAVSGNLVDRLDSRWLSALLDPFGINALQEADRYRTIAEQNRSAVGLTGYLLLNRLTWLAVAAIGLFGLYWRFSFALPRVRRPVHQMAELSDTAASPQWTGPAALRWFEPQAAERWGLTRLWHLFTFEMRSLLANQVFWIIVAVGAINLVVTLAVATGAYETTTYKVTYEVVDSIRGGFYLFLVGLIVFYSGATLWRARECRMHEIIDACPVATWPLLLAKLLALLSCVLIVLASTIVIGVAAQLISGYSRLQLPVYLQSLLVLDGLAFFYIIVMAMLIQVLVHHRYVGYFAVAVALVLNGFLWPVIGVESNLVKLASVPSATYSDMNGFGPFVPSLAWFNAYWIIFHGLLIGIMVAAVVRGCETGWRRRLGVTGQRLWESRWPMLLGSTLLLACGGWIYYNTHWLNQSLTSRESEKIQRDYELAYGENQAEPQPRWESLAFHLDVYPEQRDVLARVEAVVVNKTDQPIERLHFTLPLAARPEAVRIEIAGAETELDDSRLYYRIVRLAHPLAAGERLPVTIHTDLVTRGFENEVSLTQLTQNGTFFNSGDILPVLGYNRDMEVSDPNRRGRLGLPPRQRMATLDLSDEVARSRNYVSKDADWVKMTTVISTAADQLAVAPGSLVGQWDEPGRRYFEYHLDHIALNFCSFISARYEVARERWQDVDIEVYHIPEHAYNVPNMLLSIRKSLEYYTENFGPYYHRQCRIIEFPRYSEFAQAFPGTMPYSEGIGFIADLRNVGPDQIDFVFYVVAHEMAHQYWAHQLVGADMQGAELLSEAFAQYSALMVMEREYGRENMRKFLRLEMDRYLAGRTAEPESEQPLIRAEHQGYIHYNKGSVVMYYLKEMIGEDRVNRALRMLLEQYAYQEPPYPTSLCAVAAFRSVTPPELQYLIDDWLEQITMMSNQTVEATCTRDGDQYLVRLQTRSEKFRVDGQGNEQPLPLDDFIDIGVFGVPEAGKSLGAPLVYERRRLTAGENTFEFRVDELPHTAGIDPYNYLIDRQPHTNVQRVELR